MKKIIIARNILHVLGAPTTIFGRGTIATYPARTSEEILNIHGARKADLIITDATLPIMGAVNLCAAIRNDEALRNVSIIVVSDRADQLSEQWREAGANAVVQKPVNAAQLFLKISELLVIPQRKDLRVPLHVAVRNQGKKAAFSAVSQNISISGILIETDLALQKGDRLTCVFNIAHSEIHMEGLVTRADAGPSGKRLYGVLFQNAATKTMVVIDHFIKQQIKQ